MVLKLPQLLMYRTDKLASLFQGLSDLLGGPTQARALVLKDARVRNKHRGGLLGGKTAGCCSHAVTFGYACDGGDGSSVLGMLDLQTACGC